MLNNIIMQPCTVVPLLKATLTRGHPSYEARIFCPHYYKVNRFLPLAKGHLSYVATICSQIGWPYKRGTTVYHTLLLLQPSLESWREHWQ